MFRNVITGYKSKLKVIQGHNFGSMSYQGQTNLAKCVYCHIQYIYIYQIWKS